MEGFYQDSKVYDQHLQSNEVKNSNAMEKRGLEKVVEWIHSHHLEIGTIITDRHLQIQKWIRENLPQTTHFYDVWHVAKGMYIISYGNHIRFNVKMRKYFCTTHAFNF